MDHAIRNDSKEVLHVGGKMIAPGETRHFFDHEIPAHQRHLIAGQKKEADKQENDESSATDILAGTVPEIKVALPDLADDELLALAEREEGGKNRNGVMEAIQAELLARASGKFDTDAFVADLGQMDEETLVHQIEVHGEDEGRMALVQAEIDKRAAENIKNG